MPTPYLDGWKSAPGVYVQTGNISYGDISVLVLTGTRKGNSYNRVYQHGDKPNGKPAYVQWNCLPKAAEQADYDYYPTVDDALLVHTSGIQHHLLMTWK